MLIKQGRMTARYGEDDLVSKFVCMNAHGFLHVCMCLQCSVCVRACMCLSVCTVVRGKRIPLFQHQQADESLGPNSLEAELALLRQFSLGHKQTNNFKFQP